MPKGRTLMRLRKKAIEVNRRLTEGYGRHHLELDDDPIAVLVETILSQNTTDVNSHRCFLALKRRYSDWGELLQEDWHAVALIIRTGGLAEIKSKRIIGALNHIMDKRGSLSLDFLAELELDAADAWLSEIHGVGKKTRSIVLLFAFGMAAFPVDTHVHRVSMRLGLICQRTSRERAESDMSLLVPPEEYYNMHLNLIEHGRRVCRARNPGCSGCILSDLCENRIGLGKSQH
ncbi:MAG: endonuclease III [Thermoplasmata archaeon]|nr:endonuclease III [Thermoplasmata archaeon]